MEAERYQQVRRVFAEASRLAGAERTAYLERECAGDPDLRREVERLLTVPTMGTMDIVPPYTAPPLNLGRYEIERELGRGGMGIVYAAFDPERGERVALKVVHPHLAVSTSFFERFSREGKLGERVRHHNVVRTLGAEAVEGNFFLVMEHVEGRTLRALLADLGTVPEGLLREIALQVADGLQAIHDAGIVHRDLKPENVLITDDQRIRIMDLGIAKAHESSVQLTRAGQFVGSLHYAAPEQCEGEKVGAPADLYSLGVLLYELATGHNPFHREDAVAAIHAHLELHPEPASDLNPELSPLLTEVIATLLEKQPDQRFASGTELSRVLREGEAGSWWAEREQRTREHRLPRVPVRRATHLHGRGRELAVLEQAWSDASAGRGRTIFIEGEAGLGKSRLMDAFLRSLESHDVHMLYGSYPPTGGMRGLCDAVVDKLGARGLEKTLRSYLTVTPSLIPAFAALVRYEAPPQEAASLQGDALQAVCCHLLAALAKERPTLWVMEDLHFAPEPARAVALAMARMAAEHRALLVLTARPGLQELADFRAEGFEQVQLGRLSPREVVELLRDAFKDSDLADKLGSKIAYKSDGVPFFIFEMIHGLQEGQYLQRLSDGAYVQTRAIDEIEVPSAVRELISGHLSELSRDDRALLDVGAVQGFEFDAELIAAVLQRPLVAVLQDLADIERRHDMIRSSGRRHRFDHHQIHEVVYADLAGRLREEYHALIADALSAGAEAKSRELRPRDCYKLVLHYLHGGRPQNALRYLDTAFLFLEDRGQNESALEMTDLLLRHETDLEPTILLSTLFARAKALDGLGRNEEKLEAIERAIGVAEQTGDKALEAKAVGMLAKHHRRHGAYDEAIKDFDRALALAREMDDRQHEGTLLGARGLVFWHRGDYDTAQQHFEHGLSIAREIEDRADECYALANLALVAIQTGRFENGRRLFEESTALSEQLGSAWKTAINKGNLGVVLWQLGRLQEAREHYDLYLAMARDFGYRYGEAVGNRNMAEIFLRWGHPQKAGQMLDRSLQIARRLGMPKPAWVALIALGALERDVGDVDRAREFLKEAFALLRSVGNPVGEASCKATMGSLEALRGDGRYAVELLEDAAAQARKLAAPDTLMLAVAHRAILPGADLAAALETLSEFEERLGVSQRIETHYLFWKATGDGAHLREAKRLLAKMRKYSPEEHHDSLMDYPLHRQVQEATP